MVWRRRSVHTKGKVNVVLLHQDDKARKELEDIVKNHSMLNLVGSARDVEHYDAPIPIEDQNNQIYLIEAVEGKERDPHPEIRLVKELRGRNKNAHVVLLTGKDTSQQKYEMIAATNRLSAINISKGSESNKKDLKSYVEDCIQAGTLSQMLNVGVIGMGDIGSNIARQLINKPWLGNLYWHTQNDSTLAFDTFVHGGKYDEKVTRIVDMPDMFAPELGLDVLVVARGKRRGDMEKAPPRDKVVWEDFPDTLRKIVPIYDQVEKTNFSGAVLTFSNPPGVCQWVAHNWYGIPAASLSSVACDTIRTKRFVRDMIVHHQPSLKPRIGIDDIDIEVWGEHGTGIVPYWEAATVNSEQIREFLRGESIPFSDSDLAQIRNDVIKYSQDNKKKAKESGINSFDVAMATESALDAMARFQQINESMLYSQMDDYSVGALYGSSTSPVANPFLIIPTRIQYDGQYAPMRTKIAFKRNAGLFDVPQIRALPQRMKSELIGVIDEQARYVQAAKQVLGI